MFCPKCGNELPQNAAFCSACGHAVEADDATCKPSCAYCGATLEEGGAFCRTCGKVVSSEDKVQMLDPQLRYGGAAGQSAKPLRQAPLPAHAPAYQPETRLPEIHRKRKSAPIAIAIGAVAAIAVAILAVVLIVSTLQGGESTADKKANPIMGTLSVDQANHIRGKADVAVFTIPVEASNSVELTDGVSTFAMRDDGKDGDAEAGDGIFSYSYETSAINVQETEFEARADDMVSNPVSLFVFAPQDELTEEAVEEQRVSVTEAVSASESAFATSAGYVKPSDVSKVLETLEPKLQALKSSGEIVHYEVGSDGAYIKLSCGIGVVYNPPVEDTAGWPEFAKSSLNIAAYSPFSDMAFEERWGFTLSDYLTDIASSNSLDSKTIECHEGAKVNLESIKSLPENALIIWNGHGGYSSATGPTLLINQRFDPLAFYTDGDYFDDVMCDSIVTTAEKLEDKIYLYVEVTPSFFNKYYSAGDLKDDIVFMISCHGAQDERLAEAFLSKGAKSFVGFSNSVDIQYCQLIVTHTIGTMCNTDVTLSQALDKAMEDWGTSDRVFAIEHDYGPKDVPSEADAAYPKIYGNDQYKFVTAKNGATADPKFGNSRYRYIEPGVVSSWEEAKEYCEKLGGHLATISSQEENDFLFDYIQANNAENAYFGFSDSDSEGNWTWVTGESVSYTNWHSGEPNAESSDEDYAMFYWKFADGTWNDGNFGNGTVRDDTAFICEWDDGAQRDEGESQLPEQDALEAFLLRMWGYHNGVIAGSGESSYEYDSEHATEYATNILSNIATRPEYSIANVQNLYPVTIFLSSEDTQNNGSPEDPLGKFVQYVVCDGDGIEWLLKNIFNVSDDDYLALQNAGEGYEGVGEYYYHDSKYYSRVGGVGGAYRSIEIVSWEKDGSRYNIHFRLYSGMESDPSKDADGWRDLYAQMALKTIDGNKYWSIYRLSESNDDKPASSVLDEAESETVYNGHRYALVADEVSWTEAKAICEEAGGHLVTITSQEENDVCMNLVQDRSCMIGLSDAEEEGNMVWVTGEKCTYTNFDSGEPNNQADEDYVLIYKDGTWNDGHLDRERWPYICEWESV